MDLCVRNETSASPECVGAQTDALQSGGNGSLETSSIGSNVSAALGPQRMREKGEWTPAQLEPDSTVQTICPKTRTFQHKPSPQTSRKERLMSLDTNRSNMAAWEASVMHWDDCWYLCFFSESGTGGKVCHDRIQILSIACFLLLARLIPVSIFEAFPSLLSKILMSDRKIFPEDFEIWGYNWIWHDLIMRKEISEEQHHMSL